MNKQRLADLVLLGIAFIWGTTFLLVQNAIDALPPYSFLFVRFLWAFLFLLVIMIWQSRKRTADVSHSRLQLPILLAGSLLAIWLFIGYAFQTVGLIYTTSSKAGFITGLNVVMVPIFSLLILKQRLKMTAVIGVLLASAGLYFLAFGDQLSGGNIGESLVWNKGDLLVLFGTVGFAMQIVFTGKYAPKFNVLLLTIVELGFVALFSLVFAIRYEDLTPLLSLATYMNPLVIFALVVTAFLATALAFLAQTHYQQYTTPTRVALIFAMEPIFAALAGVVIGGEILTVLMLIGCALILMGMILAEMPGHILLRPFRLKNKVESET